MRRRNGLARHQPDHYATDQTWSGRSCDTIEIGPDKTCVRHDPPDQKVDLFDMRPRSDLGNDTAKFGMFGNLARHLLGQYCTFAIRGAANERGGGFVAGRISPEKGGVFRRFPSETSEGAEAASADREVGGDRAREAAGGEGWEKGTSRKERKEKRKEQTTAEFFIQYVCM